MNSEDVTKENGWSRYEVYVINEIKDLKQSVVCLNAKVDKLQEFRWKIVGAAAALGTIGGGGVAGLIKLLGG